MKEKIENFPKQLKFKPELKNDRKWALKERYLLVGMGGSHLQGDILKALLPDFPLSIHSDYGLPSLISENTGIIIASFSGNTAEAIDALEVAIERKISVAVIAKGGTLLEIAKKEGIPYIQLKEEDIQPRHALGYSVKALLSLFNMEELSRKIEKVSKKLEEKQENLRKSGKRTAKIMEDKIPIIYSSQRNYALSYNWKIKFNETSKIPGFYNLIPELNHNEMTGFDITKNTKKLSQKMIFIFLRDNEDDLRNQKRMDVTASLFKERGLDVLDIEVEGKTRIEKIFTSLLFADWISYYLAQYYGVVIEDVPMVEEFKKMI